MIPNGYGAWALVVAVIVVAFFWLRDYDDLRDHSEIVSLSDFRPDQSPEEMQSTLNRLEDGLDSVHDSTMASLWTLGAALGGILFALGWVCATRFDSGVRSDRTLLIKALLELENQEQRANDGAAGGARFTQRCGPSRPTLLRASHLEQEVGQSPLP